MPDDSKPVIKDNHQAMLLLLQAAVDDFEKAASRLDALIEPVGQGMRDAKLARKLALHRQLDYLSDTCKALKAMAEKQMVTTAEAIITEMRADELPSIDYDGYRFSPDEKLRVNVTADNKPFVISWLKTSSDGKELVREDFNIQSLTAFIKGLRESGGKEPSFVNVYEQPALSVRKLPGKRIHEHG